jgi:hypothetical protein
MGADVSSVIAREKLILLFVVLGNGVRERSDSVSVIGVEPTGVGVLLRGFSKY